MLLPKVTCLPSFDASLVCHLVSTSAQNRRLGGRPGGMLYVEPKDAATAVAGTREAALQGWTKWLIHHDFDQDKTT
eukprot:scaffold35309_cov206-Amphora_coffeaeformis.AAC.1